MDNEIYGTGNAYDFGARIYDSRLGKFLSIDPDFRAYPYFSSYLFAANSPIKLIDENGEGPIDPTTGKRRSWGVIKVYSDIRIIKQYEKSNDPNAKDRPFYLAAGAAGFIAARGQVSGVEGDEDIKPKKYYTLLNKEYTDLKGNDLTVSIETAFTSPYSEVQAWVQQNAAESGNYMYAEEISSNMFEVGTVQDGVIRSLETFEKGKNGKFDRTSITEYTISKGDIMERETAFGGKEKYRTVKTTEVTRNFKTGKDSIKEYSYEEVVD